MDKLETGLRGAVRMVRRRIGSISSIIGGGITKAFAGAFRAVTGILGRMLGFIGRWARRVTLVVGGALAAGIGVSIKVAQDAERVFSRFGLVFGRLADEAKRFAEALSVDVGRSVIDISDGLATFQSFFVGLGFKARDAKTLSETVQRLALDFSSFNNLSDQEGLQRFISALSGSGEVLDRFGINIKQSALDIKLLELGFKKTTEGASEQEKVLARTAIILESLTQQGAVGNANQTIDEFANRLKTLRGELKDLANEVGQRFLGGSGSLVGAIIQGVRAARANLDRLFGAVNDIGRAIREQLNVDDIDGSVFNKILGGLEIALIRIGKVIGDLFSTIKAEIKAFLDSQNPLLDAQEKRLARIVRVAGGAPEVVTRGDEREATLLG